MGGPPQGIRNSIAELERLGIRNEAVCCDAPDAAWLGKDSFPVHALGPGKYGFAYTPKLGPWLEENLPRFDAVIVHGLWLWPSVCAVRAVARERRRRLKDQETKRLRGEEAEQRILSHGLGKINADKSERLAADRTEGNAAGPVTRAGGGLSAETTDGEDAVATYPLSPQVSGLSPLRQQLRCFVMPHGMLDPWFQRDKSRRVKAVRNWFYWWLVERGVVNSADALLFTCQQELELARTTFGGYRPKREINVGYGIAEPPAFEPKMREAFAARCPDLHGRPYLLFMSRVHPKKGVDLLVRAYARIAREHGARSREHGATERAETGGLRPEVGAELQVSGFTPQVSDVPDLVIAGPGWESDYGREVRGLIDEANRTARAEAGDLRPEVSETADGVDAAATKSGNSAPIHAVAMLSGDAKWGALYGCEAFVLPSHQENFGIAVVEALACGKPVLISDQVNIWREIAEDGAGLVEEDTEEGVEKLLRKFLSTQRDEGGSASAQSDYGVTRGGPRECYLKRFAIGPAAAKLGDALRLNK